MRLALASCSPPPGIVMLSKFDIFAIMLSKLGQSDPTSAASRKGTDASEAIRLSARDLNIE